ncbi:MAG: DUF1707 SHOCT-like domain-containing protein [Acidimicrobiales bacterium]
MIETALALLVFLAPFLLLGLLIAVLDGLTGSGTRRSHRSPQVEPPPTSRDAERTCRLLASDAERDRVLETISRAVGEGRLNLDEAERRIDAVLHARHRHELVELIGDLPQPALSASRNRRSSTPLRAGLLALAAAAILAAVVAQAVAGVWELWPVAVAGCGSWAARPRR